MFTIGKQIYYFDDVISQIKRLHPKTKTIINKFKYDMQIDYNLKIRSKHNNYIAFKDYSGCVAVFDARLIEMHVREDEFYTDVREFVEDKCYMFRELILGLRVLVNDIKSGQNLISKFMPFDNFCIV